MSTIIIRLQNLPLSAKAADIREFFGDLKIPKGSVNIVGGHLGDAFIEVTTDEDARLAMLLDGRLLHNSRIRLMLSSKREMEQVISFAQTYGGKPQTSAQSSQNESTIQSPPDPSQITIKENQWAFVKIGNLWPLNTYPLPGRNDLALALTYNNTIPLHGYAWNDGGVVQASFPHNGTQLTGTDFKADIQILLYEGDHNNNGFWYQWIKYEDRFENTDQRKLVRCGDSMPIMYLSRRRLPLFGNLDIQTETAFTAPKFYSFVGRQITDKGMKVLVRNLRGGPPDCKCENCAEPRTEYE